MRRRTLRLVLTASLAISALGLAPTTSVVADDCPNNRWQAANMWHGDASDWTKKPNTLGTGWNFSSSDDELIKATMAGTLTFDTGQYLWSSPGNVRFIAIDHGTVWCRDKRGADDNRPLSKVVRSRSMAVAKFKAGTVNNWSRELHSQSRGWHFVATERTQIWVPPGGKANHEYGTTTEGNWTPAVFVATVWY